MKHENMENMKIQKALSYYYIREIDAVPAVMVFEFEHRITKEKIKKEENVLWLTSGEIVTQNDPVLDENSYDCPFGIYLVEIWQDCRDKNLKIEQSFVYVENAPEIKSEVYANSNTKGAYTDQKIISNYIKEFKNVLKEKKALNKTIKTKPLKLTASKNKI